MRLFIVDPKKRLTAQQAFTNSWIQGKTARIDHLTASINNLRVIVNKKRAKVSIILIISIDFIIHFFNHLI